MKKAREEVTEIFKQLTPANQRYFMTILRVAETAQNNAEKAGDSEPQGAALEEQSGGNE